MTEPDPKAIAKMVEEQSGGKVTSVKVTTRAGTIKIREQRVDFDAETDKP